MEESNNRFSCFLLRPSFEPLSAEEAAKASVPQRLGLQYVRGCEIIEVRDEEGTLMNDFTGRIKRDEWKPPKGELKTVTVALDTAQYHMYVSNIAEKGADDVYRIFNILMRRKPKENNFKAILESIRDLMNEYCIVPDWLHNVFLGYGNPSATQRTNMPDLLEMVDFNDTFRDADHLKDGFPDCQAKIVAMTCTHAALKRKDFLQLGFKYDNLLMEESAQILEIETFIPMLFQRQEDGYARLKRCILIGDPQLPPVVKNMAFQKYCHMDQSLFTRFVRLGIPYIELNAQGRARPSIAELYNWSYRLEIGST